MTKDDGKPVQRIRPFMKRRKGHSEKNVFAELFFFINGNVTVGPWKGSLIVRLAKNSAAKALTRNFKTDTSVYQLSRAKN